MGGGKRTGPSTNNLHTNAHTNTPTNISDKTNKREKEEKERESDDESDESESSLEFAYHIRALLKSMSIQKTYKQDSVDETGDGNVEISSRSYFISSHLISSHLISFRTRVHIDVPSKDESECV